MLRPCFPLRLINWPRHSDQQCVTVRQHKVSLAWKKLSWQTIKWVNNLGHSGAFVFVLIFNFCFLFQQDSLWNCLFCVKSYHCWPFPWNPFNNIHLELRHRGWHLCDSLYYYYASLHHFKNRHTAACTQTHSSPHLLSLSWTLFVIYRLHLPPYSPF